MHSRSRLAVVALAIALAGCIAPSSTSSSEGGDAPEPPNVVVPKSAAGPTIAAIKTHDGVIAIASSLDGLRVTLADVAGAVTARDLSLDELRARAPDAYEIVTTSRAVVDDRATDPRPRSLDASIDRRLVDDGPRDPRARNFGGGSRSRH